ncbi:MAG: NAD+ synthase, partial [Phycisphaerae bacterium]|nr:NAD+ synthase [Phycisphaerae bacterium]
MRIAPLQLDPVVGDVQGNAARMLDAARTAASLGAELAVTSELAICGYPPRDLIEREGFVERCERAVASIAAQCPMPMLIGSPRRVGRRTRNAVAFLRGGRIEAWYDKRLLPTYDVFDEWRHFEPGTEPLVIEVAGRRVGVLVCEDLWRADDAIGPGRYACDPVAECAALGVRAVVSLSASPFRLGKHERQTGILQAAAARIDGIVVSVNQIGANDDLVFEGASSLVGPNGTIAELPRFAEAVEALDLDMTARAIEPRDAQHDTFRALVAAIEGYLRKTGHSRAIIGLSGGIDSAVVAALCVRALGAANVRGVMMPSRFSSDHSLSDARASARSLGMPEPELLPIGAAHELIAQSIGAVVPLQGLADENLQSRLRGITLMALSNATGAMVVSTGNKSELAVGYATLYGDMCGGIAPIGDLTKGQVYALARWMNDHHARAGFALPPVPEGSITKPPSAELRPDQRDQDTLPPYDELDAIVHGFVDLEQSPASIAKSTGLDEALVRRWCLAIDRAQFKREQAGVVPKISARAFGPGRRLPLAMR